jgi:hypothetical protein
MIADMWPCICAQAVVLLVDNERKVWVNLVVDAVQVDLEARWPQNWCGLLAAPRF